MPRILLVAVAVSAVFALAAIGAFAVEGFLLASDARALIQQVRDQKILQHADGAVTDLGRAAREAGGVLDTTRDIERDNRKDIKAVNLQTLVTLSHVDALVLSFDASQKQAAAAIEQTSAALVPVMQQTQQNLRALQPAINQVAPLLQRSTDIAVNLSNATADVEHEIHKLVYPPPRKWWQKYFLDPLRVAAHLVTIPVTH